MDCGHFSTATSRVAPGAAAPARHQSRGKRQSLDSEHELGTARFALAIAEVWLGTTLIVASVLYQVMVLLDFQFELAGALALLPMLVFRSAILLAGAGASMRRFPDRPVLTHLPLLLWLVVFYLAFV